MRPRTVAAAAAPVAETVVAALQVALPGLHYVEEAKPDLHTPPEDAVLDGADLCVCTDASH